MIITITSADGENVAQLSVEGHQSIASIAEQLRQHFGIPAGQQALLLNGGPLPQTTTFAAAGVKDDDLLVVTQATGSAGPIAPIQQPAARPGMRLHDIPVRTDSPNATPELLLEIMDKNPNLLVELETNNQRLAQALKTKSIAEVRMVLLQIHMEAASRKFNEEQELLKLERNPMDAEAQAKIEEAIRLNNVQKNMEIAMEEMPEAFAKVFMLYVPCEVNGTSVKAFVDSGAQSTIMSSSCAERCGIMRLVDKRFAGQAVGVGTAKIIGRVHVAPLKIGNYFYNCSFTILDQQSVDFLFGLDMLKRHQCCIDLQKNVLRLSAASEVHEVPFLPEHTL
ncbi:TPA: hypothetical protein N0F65_007859 [Lagenidium giganteum]|uniref:Ubiquitin-like domain-containing protein n=1 Tax=Lagenidium giganteum TaxID=4803 RepID=A0AAV2YHS9_9STRA|nr:TPA: hypothetical protein N0F65_007859 [Lagenidium giganteum]